MDSIWVVLHFPTQSINPANGNECRRWGICLRGWSLFDHCYVNRWEITAHSETTMLVWYRCFSLGFIMNLVEVKFLSYLFPPHKTDAGDLHADPRKPKPFPVFPSVHPVGGTEEDQRVLLVLGGHVALHQHHPAVAAWWAERRGLLRVPGRACTQRAEGPNLHQPGERQPVWTARSAFLISQEMSYLNGSIMGSKFMFYEVSKGVYLLRAGWTKQKLLFFLSVITNQSTKRIEFCFPALK